MENNAINAVRSTENTTKNQTTFRLGLHLSTAHGDSADTYADFNFAGSTPEEFDHALGTILDVVTDTVYGGQLNGLREIMDRSTAEFMANAAEQEQPEEEAPAAHDDALDVMRYGQDKPQNPALLIETPPLPTKTEPQTPSRSVERPHGARGLMFLHCPECIGPSSSSTRTSPKVRTASAAQRFPWTTQPASSIPAPPAGSSPMGAPMLKRQPLTLAA